MREHTQIIMMTFEVLRTCILHVCVKQILVGIHVHVLITPRTHAQQGVK